MGDAACGEGPAALRGDRKGQCISDAFFKHRISPDGWVDPDVQRLHYTTISLDLEDWRL